MNYPKLKDNATFSIIKEVEKVEYPSGKKERNFLIKCKCGNETEKVYSHIKRAQCCSTACPLNNSRKTSFIADPNAKSKSKEYGIWTSMKQRCHNTNDQSYPKYGGRGIKVCDRWLESFDNFLEDMGPKPKGKSLDRYPDRDGDYEPSNCRWATDKQQNRNRDYTKLDVDKVKEIRSKYKPRVYTTKMLAEEYNVSQSTISHAIHNRNWKEI